MATANTIARPYATACFNTAKAENQLPAWAKMLRTVALMVADERVNRLLGSPYVGNEKIYQWFKSLKINLTESQDKFLQVLAHAKRLNVLPEIADQFLQLKDTLESTIEVNMITALPASSKITENLQMALAQRFGKKIQIHTSIDANIIGGAIFKTNDLVLDGSVKGKLKALEAALLQ